MSSSQLVCFQKVRPECLTEGYEFCEATGYCHSPNSLCDANSADKENPSFVKVISQKFQIFVDHCRIFGDPLSVLGFTEYFRSSCLLLSVGLGPAENFGFFEHFESSLFLILQEVCFKICLSFFAILVNFNKVFDRKISIFEVFFLIFDWSFCFLVIILIHFCVPNDMKLRFDSVTLIRTTLDPFRAFFEALELKAHPTP